MSLQKVKTASVDAMRSHIAFDRVSGVQESQEPAQEEGSLHFLMELARRPKATKQDPFPMLLAFPGLASILSCSLGSSCCRTWPIASLSGSPNPV